MSLNYFLPTTKCLSGDKKNDLAAKALKIDLKKEGENEKHNLGIVYGLSLPRVLLPLEP